MRQNLFLSAHKSVLKLCPNNMAEYRSLSFVVERWIHLMIFLMCCFFVVCFQSASSDVQTVSWLQGRGQSVVVCFRFKFLAAWSARSTNYTSSIQTSNWRGVCKAHRGAALNILWCPLRCCTLDKRLQAKSWAFHSVVHHWVRTSPAFHLNLSIISAPILSAAPQEYRCPPQGFHLICTCCFQPMPDRRAELNNQQVAAQQCECSLTLLVPLPIHNDCCYWFYWLHCQYIHTSVTEIELI